MSTISREATLENLLDVLVKKNSLFETNAHFLNTCAQLGFAEKKRLKIKNKGQQIKSETFVSTGLVDYVWMIAFAETKDPFTLDDTDECYKIFEEYANGGFHIISKEISKHNAKDPSGIETFISFLKRQYQKNGGRDDATAEPLNMPED